ncbi:hypothetical protein HZA98_01800 [Candidatus Woesearchaeota archaeon]|nr:hypothetical protein [Candidatus Woesearchaeota archaeon]
MDSHSQLNKKGMIAWEYIAAIILALIVILIILLFSKTIKENIIQGISYFTSTVLGR